jgi:hypothetical protein
VSAHRLEQASARQAGHAFANACSFAGELALGRLSSRQWPETNRSMLMACLAVTASELVVLKSTFKVSRFPFSDAASPPPRVSAGPVREEHWTEHR